MKVETNCNQRMQRLKYVIVSTKGEVDTALHDTMLNVFTYTNLVHAISGALVSNVAQYLFVQ